MHCAPCTLEKTFRVAENHCLQCVESIFVNLPQFAKSGLKESLNRFFWYFLYIFLDNLVRYRTFLFLWVFVSLQYVRWWRHGNVRLEAGRIKKSADKGGETSAPLFIQCVMRSRTGTSVLSALPVRLKAGKIFLFANWKSFFLSVISGYNVK